MIAAFAKVFSRSPAFWLPALYRLVLWGCVSAFTWRALDAAWRFTIDDSGISYAYAKHLARGWGPVAAPGAPWVEGYSNAAWVFSLIPFEWLGAPLPETSKWLGVAAFTAMGLAGAGLLVLSYGPRVGTAALAALWVLLCGVCLEIVVWVVAGLENALLGALLLVVAAFDLRERARPHAFPWSALLAFVLCITRPEGVMYAAPVITLRLWDVRRSPVARPTALRALLLFGGLLALYHIGHLLVFHQWVPNTYFAKPQGRSLAKGFDYLRRSLQETGLLYILPLALLGAVGRWREKAALVWYCVAGVLFVLYSGGDWMPYARFVSFFAAPLLLLGVHGVYNVSYWVSAPLAAVRKEWRSRLIEGGAAVTLLVAMVAWRGYHQPRLAKLERSKYCHFCQRTKDAKKLQKTSAAARLGRVTTLTHDFGGPSFVSDLSSYPIDFLGLCDATVARIRRAQDYMWVNTLLSPYLFHEQPHAPSWIYLPRNFWKQLGDFPEFTQGYYGLSARLLPYAPGGSYLALHKGELVDFFPPLDPESRPARISDDWVLVGAGWFALGSEPEAVTAGSRVRIIVSLLPLRTPTSREEVWLEVGDGRSAVKSEHIPVGRNIKGLERQLASDEPLRFDFTLTIPKSAAWSAPRGTSEPTVAIRVGVNDRTRKGKAAMVDIVHWTKNRQLLPLSKGTPRFPSGLPAPAARELIELEAQVFAELEQQYQGNVWSPSPHARALAERVRGIGDRLLGDQPTQAYLAYVWATQLDARQWEELTEPLLALRQPISDSEYGAELALLRDFYRGIAEGERHTTATNAPESPTESAPTAEQLQDPVSPEGLIGESPPAPYLRDPAERLIAFYREAGLSHRAEYFTGFPSGRALGVNKIGSATEPWRELSFSSGKPGQPESTAWSGDEEAFGIETLDSKTRHSLRGVDGDSFLSSRKNGAKGKGTYLSPEFVVPGAKVSFSFGGGNSSDVGVELLVDGKVVRATSKSPEAVLQLVWWDVSEFVGRRARLRVYDKSARKVALLDRVLLWN